MRFVTTCTLAWMLMLSSCNGEDGLSPTKGELAQAEPAKVEPAKAEPAKAEPAKAEPAKAEAAPVAAKRGLVQAVVVDKGPPIDGTLKDPAWAKCPPMELGQCSSPKTHPLATTARVLFDATKLYVAFECVETDTDGLQMAVAERDGDVWQDDCVELFVTGDLRTGYYHFSVNPKGALFDSRTTDANRDDKSYDSKAEAKAAVEKGKGWTVTLAIPLKDLGAYVGANQDWVLNLNRTRPARGGQPLLEWSWAIMGGSDYHAVADYGSVKGVTIAKRDDGVTREAAPAPPPPQSDKGAERAGIIVYKEIPTLDIPDKGKGTEWGMDLNIRSAAGLKVAFVARGTGGVNLCPFNMADKRSKDNTTAIAYRHVDENWRPIVYQVDRFRYNGGAPDGRIKPDCEFTNIRFHSNNTGGKGVLQLRNFVIYRGEDAAAPEAPAELKAQAAADGVKLTWKPAKDNAGVALYAVSRADADGKFAKIAECIDCEFVDKPAAAGSYKYRVLAADFQDNVGPWSNEASAKLDKASPAVELTKHEQDRLNYAEHVRAIHEAGKGKISKGKVMMFGDSITGATLWPVEAEGGTARYKVVAHGYASMRTDFGKNRIADELKGENPEFCFIMYGTNNNKAEAALPPAMEDLLAIAKTCEANGTVPIIATIPPRGFADPDSKPEANFNVAVVKMCKENKIPVAYLFENFQAGGDRKKLVAGDGVHLVDGGFYQAGLAWGATMRQVSFVLMDRP